MIENITYASLQCSPALFDKKDSINETKSAELLAHFMDKVEKLLNHSKEHIDSDSEVSGRNEIARWK